MLALKEIWPTWRQNAQAPEVNVLALNIKHEITCRSERDLSISVSTSIGIAAATQVGHSLQKLLIYADTALYQAKADNRNCVRVWPE